MRKTWLVTSKGPKWMIWLSWGGWSLLLLLRLLVVVVAEDGLLVVVLILDGGCDDRGGQGFPFLGLWFCMCRFRRQILLGIVPRWLKVVF